MDAKSKADFINSVASGDNIPCPKCGTGNSADSKFCFSCGTKLTVSRSDADKADVSAPANAAASQKDSECAEPNNVFAQGLPEWNVEPPQVIIRRRC